MTSGAFFCNNSKKSIVCTFLCFVFCISSLKILQEAGRQVDPSSTRIPAVLCAHGCEPAAPQSGHAVGVHIVLVHLGFSPTQ